MPRPATPRSTPRLRAGPPSSRSLRPFRHARCACAALAIAVGLAALGGPNAAATGQPQTITVSAAASLTAAFQAVARAFEAVHPEHRVALNFAGSPTLVQQIREGAPADVFASADEPNMQKLVDAGEVAATPAIFARNRLQIAVAKGNPSHVTGLADLAKPGMTVALCAETVPCGRYAREAFGKAGVALPAASQELDVKAVLTRVALGEADAGIVYVTDVMAAGGTIEGVAMSDAHDVEPRYPIAVLRDAPNPTGARAFAAYVLGPEGQAVLRTFGFTAP